jgi:hypothetical protein
LETILGEECDCAQTRGLNLDNCLTTGASDCCSRNGAGAVGLIGGATKSREIVKVFVMVVGLVMMVRFLVRREIAGAGTAGRAAGLIRGAMKARLTVKALAMVSGPNLINSNMWHISSRSDRILTRPKLSREVSYAE